MNFSLYLLSIFLASLFGWASFFIVLNKLSPYESPTVALIFFYVSLFIALTGTFSLVGFYARRFFYHNEIYFYHLTHSIRQGILLSIMTCVGFIFQHMRVLTWWDGVLLVALVFFVELYFMTKEN